MKGVKIHKARPSSAIDIYPLLREASKEGVLLDNPTDRQLEQYYFGGLLAELTNPTHCWLLARRGRGYLGCLHAVLIPGRWDLRTYSAFIDLVYVTKNRRKNGIGRQLIDEFVKEAQNDGIIKRVDFLCPEDQREYWVKERGGKVVRSMMRVEL